MHFKKVKSILSKGDSMNIYRGCSHGCIYCDSRSLCYGFDHDFEDIKVKENAIELLEQSLMSKRKLCMIGTGSMCDPYIPIEKKLHYTRKSMELAYKYGYGFTCITKSASILNDLDLLKQINEQSKCVVQITLTTFDENLCKIIEPNVSTTKERFEALCTLRDNGIPTIVWFTPILPFINDNKENFQGIINYCIKANVKGIIYFGAGMTLREGSREYFYTKLDSHFPSLKEKYIRKYKDNYILNSDNNYILTKYFHTICNENNIMHNNDEIFKYLKSYENKYEAEQLLF